MSNELTQEQIDAYIERLARDEDVADEMLAALPRVTLTQEERWARMFDDSWLEPSLGASIEAARIGGRITPEQYARFRAALDRITQPRGPQSDPPT